MDRGARHVSPQDGARQPDTLNPDNWAIDAYAFSIPASRIVEAVYEPYDEHSALPGMDRLSAGPAAETLIVWGRNDPLVLPAGAEFVKQLRYFDASHFALLRQNLLQVRFDPWSRKLSAALSTRLLATAACGSICGCQCVVNLPGMVLDLLRYGHEQAF